MCPGRRDPGVTERSLGGQAVLDINRSSVGQWLATAGCAAVVLFGAYAAYVRGSLGRSVPLYVAPSELDFGEVWEQAALPWRIHVENRWPRLLSIERFHVSCPCVEFRPPTMELRPGERRELDLVLNLRLRPADRARATPIPFMAEIRPVVPALPDAVVWRVQGRVRSALAELPEVVDFDELGVEGGPLPEVRFEVRSHTPLQELRVRCDSPAVAFGPIVASPGRTHFSGRAALTRELPLGPFEFPAFVEAVSAQGQRLPPLPIKIVGTFVPDIQAVPDLLPLGAIRPHERPTARILVRSRTGRALTIEQVEYDPSAVRLEEEHKAGPDHSFRLRITPKRGSQEERIVFRVRQGGRAAVSVPAVVVYYGLGPSE